MTTWILPRLPLRPAALLAAVLALCGAGRAAAVCVGDCEGDGRVSIANLQACVNRASGLPAPSCAAADQNNDGSVDQNELDACIQGFLNAATCPMVFTPAPTNTTAATNTPARTNTPVPTNTSAPTATRTNTPVPTNTATAPPPPSPTPTNTAPAMVHNECDLKTGSQLFLQTAALPLNLPATGKFSIDCGAPGAGGIAECSCEVLSFNTVVIPSIGDVCVNPASGCAPGKVDCDGGTPLDVDLNANHTIGTCSSNAQCAASCEAHCVALGAGYALQSFGCEGYCQGGSNDEAECSRDSECPGGQCPGGEPVAHFDNCNCVCSGTGVGDASGAGGLSCNLGTQINVELPSNGRCGDAVTIQLAPVCGAVTSETSKGIILKANNSPASLPPTGPESVDGARISCANLQAHNITDLKLIGQLAFFDSTLGDIRSRNTFVCK
jgi:hypothetical protein